jgi:glycogen phosphorylase
MLDQTFHSFQPLGINLPQPLRPLERIAQNFYWSWDPDGVDLFRDLDPLLWDKVEEHPQKMLSDASELLLWQRAADPDYIAKLERFLARFDAYLAEPPRTISEQLNVDHPVAYFCAEYGVHTSLPIYSGGLGILAGDHLKSASDLNLPLVAIGLLYRYGYFRQDISHDGWQEEHYSNIFNLGLAIEPVNDANGERIRVSVHIRGREVHAEAWLARIGRISLYLLDTNVDPNSAIDRMITGHLYGGDPETRIVQEKVLGLGGVRLLRKLGIEPSVYHLNEGHAAFSTLELASEFLTENPEKSFADAVEDVRAKCVFTTHTPVAAGNDNFRPDTLVACFSNEFIDSLKLNKDEFIKLGRANPDDNNEYFGMTPLAIRMCRSSNAVSEKHGDVSRKLWLKMFPGLTDPNLVPISHVTNGVHAPTWVAPTFQSLFIRCIDPDWASVARESTEWSQAIECLRDEDIWNAHVVLKNMLIAFIRERTRRRDTGLKDTINERTDTTGLFSPDVLTVGFARRVAQYKRWNLLLSDMSRLLRLVDDVQRPVQFVFAGKAHPQDNTAKTILQELMSINHESNWQRRAVFIEDYDQEIARYLVQGVDVWMNLPRRPMEASGTSGMKAGMNGALNFSILDGWWMEAFNGENGFVVGNTDEFSSDSVADAEEAESLYQALENEIIPLFYNRNQSGIPIEWVSRMKNAIATITPQFSSDRMVDDYLTKIYVHPT